MVLGAPSLMGITTSPVLPIFDGVWMSLCVKKFCQHNRFVTTQFTFTQDRQDSELYRKSEMCRVKRNGEFYSPALCSCAADHLLWQTIFRSHKLSLPPLLNVRKEFFYWWYLIGFNVVYRRLQLLLFCRYLYSTTFLMTRHHLRTKIQQTSMSAKNKIKT